MNPEVSLISIFYLSFCSYQRFLDILYEHCFLSLEIDLLTERFIDGFATQGHSGHSKPRWVTGYVIQYSLDGFSWDVISTEERERVSTSVFFITTAAIFFLQGEIQGAYYSLYIALSQTI